MGNNILQERINKSDLAPNWDDNIPLCSNDCPSYDGKRCALTGFSPKQICEPAISEAMSILDSMLSMLRNKYRKPGTGFGVIAFHDSRAGIALWRMGAIEDDTHYFVVADKYGEAMSEHIIGRDRAWLRYQSLVEQALGEEEQ